MTLLPAVLDRPVAGAFAGVLLDMDGTLLAPDGAVEGASELIDHLNDTFTPWAAVTSGDTASARARLDAAGLELPVLVPRDMVAADRPDPEGYLLAAGFLGVDPADCLVVEDTDAGVAAGHAAGAQVAGLGGVDADLPLGSLHDLVTLLSREVAA